MRSLLILIVGDPVPSAQREFGGFDVMIRRAAQGSWAHDWQVIDAREPSAEWPALDAFDGAIISGSPARIGDGDAWIEKSMAFSAELVRAGKPTLGICFGHQLLGQALGGQVSANPRGREIGTVPLSALRESPLFGEDEKPLVNATHLDSVVRLPGGSECYASTTLEPNAVVRFGAVAWGVQFHPEIDRQILQCYIRERREALLAEGLDPEALSQEASDAEAGRQALPNFIKNVVR